MKKLETAAKEIENIDNPTSLPSLQPSGVWQSVKYVVNLMGNLETIDITEALEALRDSCNQFLPNSVGVRIFLLRNNIKCYIFVKVEKKNL